MANDITFLNDKVKRKNASVRHLAESPLVVQ